MLINHHLNIFVGRTCVLWVGWFQVRRVRRRKKDAEGNGSKFSKVKVIDE